MPAISNQKQSEFFKINGFICFKNQEFWIIMCNAHLENNKNVEGEECCGAAKLRLDWFCTEFRKQKFRFHISYWISRDWESLCVKL